MSQKTVEPAVETKTAPEILAEKKGFPKIVPPPQVVIEIAETGKKRVSTFVAQWRALPPQRKRIITMISLSVFVSLTMSLIARVVARLAKRPQAR